MNAETIRQYCMQKHKAYETYPFGEAPICYKLNNRIFAQLYPYPEDFKITLKCTAPVGDFYRQLYPEKIVRGYHCPPVQQPYWNTIYLEDFPDDELLHLIDLAYETVLHSFSKKVQAEILSEMNAARRAKFEDMALASSIMVTSFRSAFAAFVSQETMDACTNPDNCRVMLENIYQEGKMHFLMGGDQGFLCWRETEDGAEIVAIHSLPESWGTGLGRAMLTEALNQIGERTVHLWAFKENTRARRFYEKHGFHWDGTERVSEFDGALEVRYVRDARTSSVRFDNYAHPYYQQVCDFLIALNREKKHINWNWARWEWMYAHPYCDREKLSTIGLWLAGDSVVGAAIYDLFHGEAFCGALDGYEYLLPEILEYAYDNLKDENGLGIAVRDDDVAMQEQLVGIGYCEAEQTEPILCRDLNELLNYALPAGFAIREIRFPEDNLAYQTVIWKGFGHEGDQAELEKMLANKILPPNRRNDLCLAVVDEIGEFAAHCTCWYDERTDYAYVEPVCTIPKYRGMGLGKAVVLEALRRCKTLGAKQAFVISDQEFYKKLGFTHHSQYIFFHKP